MDSKKTAVHVDKNLLEQVHYQSSSLPISHCFDYFDDFINGEVNCHWHDEVEFGIITEGEVEYFIHHANTGYKPHILHKGDGLFVNTKALHMAKQNVSGSSMSCFLFPVNFFTLQTTGVLYKKNILPVAQSPLPGLFFKRGDGADREILDTMQQFLELNADTAGYELLCMETLCKLWRLVLLRVLQMENIQKLQKEALVQEQRMRLMLSYIHTHFSENMTVGDIAAAASISPSECFRCFKGIVKKTPVDYLTEYRLSRAASLLTNTDQAIFDICFSCGFNNSSYFGKVFKEKCGVTPGQFRKQSLSLPKACGKN